MADPKETIRLVLPSSGNEPFKVYVNQVNHANLYANTISANNFNVGAQTLEDYITSVSGGGSVSNGYITATFVSNNYLEDIKSTFGTGDVTNTYLSATFTSNNYVQDRLDTKATNTYVNSTFTSNNYVDGRFTSNSFVKATFTSNNYVQDRLDTKATNTYVNSTFTSNGYVDGRFTSNSYVKAVFTSNNYVQDRLDTKATNTYVNSTFTSNNYVDGRFTSNSYVKAVFTSNNYVDNQLNTRIGIRATNTYVQSTFTSNSFAVDTFSSNAYMRDHVATEVAAIVNSAPAALDTLNELAAALGDDPNFATTVSNQIGIRATNTYVNSTFTSNSYVDDQLNSRIGIRATNTYVNSTFTSNNYVDGRFASNNYVKAVFSSNNYVQTQLGTKLNSSSYTASDVLTKIKTVDGTGSGLDSDLLDGRDSTAYLILGTTGTVTAPQYFRSASGNPLGSLSNPPLQAFATSGNSAFMSFHRSGEYAVNFGLDTDNVLRIGGWSASANRWELDVPTGNMTIAGDLTVSGGQVTMPAAATRDKYRLWNSSTYAIGMDNNFTFGGLATEYAMTFQMNNQAGRGYWWGDNGHTDAQGAMALTTEGKLTVAHSARIGHGESDTTTPGATHALDVNGSITDDIGDVRSPQHFSISTATTITEEGVYYCTNAPTLTFGGGIEGGTIMTFYNNNASSMTINRGSFLNTIRLADNTTVNKSSVTLGPRSVATATCFITNNFILISGSDVS